MFRDLKTSTWKPGKIISKHNTSTPYVYNDDNGHNKRLNFIHLRSVGKQLMTGDLVNSNGLLQIRVKTPNRLIL